MAADSESRSSASRAAGGWETSDLRSEILLYALTEYALCYTVKCTAYYRLYRTTLL